MMHTLVHGWLLIAYFQIDFLGLVLASFYYLCIQPTFYMMALNLTVSRKGTKGSPLRM